MKPHLVLSLVLILPVLFILEACSPEQASVRATRYREFERWEAGRYHRPVQLQIGWFDYEESRLDRAENGDMIVVRDSASTAGAMPAIIVSYPDTSEVLWLDVDTDDELLGKLVKYTLMTEKPIQRPLSEYLEVVDCSDCHPKGLIIRE